LRIGSGQRNMQETNFNQLEKKAAEEESDSLRRFGRARGAKNILEAERRIRQPNDRLLLFNRSQLDLIIMIIMRHIVFL
jgi:hypothetical protein